MNDDLLLRAERILDRARTLDWNAGNFTNMKAHICAELSALVYEDVSLGEIAAGSRIHLMLNPGCVFGSLVYREKIRLKISCDLSQIFGEANFEDARLFVVRTRYAVILGARLPNVLILAIRGTMKYHLRDWQSDTDIERYYLSRIAGPLAYQQGSRFREDLAAPFFHRGFFEAIVPQLGKIIDAFRNNAGHYRDLPIIWTGHSLGAAMAAIGNAVSATPHLRGRFVHMLPDHVRGAFCFGMPRYGDLGAVCTFATPFHIYRRWDPIPTVPFRSMGYVDCPAQWELSEKGELTAREREDLPGFLKQLRRWSRPIAYHRIEGYANSMALAVQLDRP